ncbi:hypothetical protein BH23PSE1_BH23PSE1_09990 [soil metagenome]
MIVGVFRAVALAALLLAAPATQSRAGSDASAIRQIISDQIAALGEEDFETAFSYASPGIRSIFGDAERFARMVRGGFAMVLRPSAIRFAALEERGEEMMQSVLVTDENGALHVLDYHMQPSGQGWLINGVTIRRPPESGA